MTDQEEWKMAKVSILMPACNVEKFLKECMDSVVNQTWELVELPMGKGHFTTNGCIG